MKLRVVFYAATEHRFDKGISAHLKKGVKAHGDRYDILPINDYTGTPAKDTDVAVIMGVKNKSKGVYDSHLAAGKHTLIFDKGYTRIQGGPLNTLYWRVSLDSFQPHEYLFTQSHDESRWRRLDLGIQPMKRARKGQILFCGGSQKYCDWHELGNANEYARGVLEAAKAHTKRSLVYRPKPSWPGAEELAGFGYSRHDLSFRAELDRTYQTLTFGSNAGFESLLSGVPTMVLGDGIARSLARTSLKLLEDPIYPEEIEVYRLACAVAYAQWTLAEMASGECWKHLRSLILDRRA